MQIDNCEFPDDLYIDVDNDVWLRISDDSKTATIGVTTVLSFLAGKLTAVKLRKENRSVSAGQVIATLESGKYFGPIRSPIAGNISQFNLELEKNAPLINMSPYQSGWIAKFETPAASELSRLRSVQDSKDSIRSRIRELKVRCFKAMPDEDMISIGTECSTTLANLNQLLAEAPPGRVVHLVTDDPTSDIEMIRWSDQTKNRVLETRREGNLYHFIVEKTASGSH